MPGLGSRKKLHVVRKPRIEWNQATWETIAKELAKVQVRYGQGGGKLPGFKVMFDEAMIAVVPPEKHRNHVLSLKHCPPYFDSVVKAEKSNLLYKPVVPAQQKVPDLPPEEKPVSEMEGVAALLQETKDGQNRLEAKLDAQQHMMTQFFTVIEAVLTAPQGTKPEEITNQPEVRSALRAIEKDEVILVGIRPKYREEIERQYGSWMKLRIYPFGETKKVEEITNFNKTKHIISAHEFYTAGLRRLCEKAGKTLVELHGMSNLRKALDSIVSRQAAVYMEPGIPG